MIDQLHSAAIYLSKHYPPSSIPKLIKKLAHKHPSLAKRLQYEFNQLLSITLSQQHFQPLHEKLPTFFNPKTQIISLRDCYSYPQMPPTLLHFLELLFAQQQGQEKAFRDTEYSLSRIRSWGPLRDFYLRYIQRQEQPSPLQQEARQKALLLATHLAPHPTHALQLLLDWLEHPHAPHPAQLHSIIQRFYQFGWCEHLSQLLQVIAETELLTSKAALYQQAGKELKHRVQQRMFLQHRLNSTPAEKEELATVQTDVYEARWLWMRAAQQYNQNPSQRAQAVRCWRSILTEDLTDPNSWQYLYETLIPVSEWELLDAVLSPIQRHQVLLPSPAWLRYPFLEALRQQQLQHTDPLPFCLQALLQDPKDIQLFAWVTKMLMDRKQWKQLRKVYQLHLVSLDDPLRIQEVLQQLVEMYSQLSLLEQAVPVALMALTFHPQNRNILAHLVSWSQKMSSQHPIHRILCTMANEGFGSQAFQLLCPPSKPAEQPNLKHERILQKNPQNVEALHRVRQQALEQRDFEKALKLYQHELEMQQAPPARAFLLRSIAELCHFYLQRHTEALHNYRLAQQLTPQDPDLLLSLAELYETRGEYRNLIPTLGKLLNQLPSPQQHPQFLRKIVHVALDHLHDHSTAIQALSDLLLYHPPIHLSLDLIHKIALVEAARPALISLLFEREKELPTQERPFVWLEICRSLFLHNLHREARDWLQRIIELPDAPVHIAQEAEKLAARYLAWPELMMSLQRRILKLEKTPDPSVSLADLYLQLGELEQQHKNLKHARTSYRRALLHAPLHPIAFERVRADLYEQGAYTELRILLHKQAPCITNHRIAAATYTQLALLEHHLSQPEDAMIHLQQAQRLDRESSRIAELLHRWKDQPTNE